MEPQFKVHQVQIVLERWFCVHPHLLWQNDNGIAFLVSDQGAECDYVTALYSIEYMASGIGGTYL